LGSVFFTSSSLSGGGALLAGEKPDGSVVELTGIVATTELVFLSTTATLWLELSNLAW